MKITTLPIILCFGSAIYGAPDYPSNPAGNPFVSGLYADPDGGFFNNQYWVYPSHSEDAKQTGFDAFSSPDLIHWTKHTDVLTRANFKWAEKAFFAPSSIERNGSFYLFFSAQFPIGNGNYLDGIGVGISSNPSGPFTDAINGTIVAGINNNAYSMDQQVFVDDDGQTYMYWGSGSHCNVAKLASNLTALTPFADGSTIKEITPDPQFVEGVYVFKRNGHYYMLWSEGLYGGDSYSVAYGMASSPMGPFTRREKILQSDYAVATGTGHNGLLHPPNTDIYYIVYHRHPLHYTAWDDRQLAYDRLHFNPDGTIQPVKLLVRDNFDDGNMLGWTTHGGSWDASSGSLVGGNSAGGKALLNTNFGDVGCDVRVTIRGGSHGGDAGFLFHVGDDVGDGSDDYQGYYAGISTMGYVVLGRANHGQWSELGRVQRGVSADVAHLLRVRVTGDLIEVLLDDMSKSVISVHDGTYRSGKTGVRVFYTEAIFDDVVFEHI